MARKTIAQLEAELAEANKPLKGNDPRLKEFWAEGQQLAEDHDHCEEFDQIAEELGGPRRAQSYDVSITLSVMATGKLAAMALVHKLVSTAFDHEDLVLEYDTGDAEITNAGW